MNPRGIQSIEDRSNGYDDVAFEHMARREQLSVGVATVRRWASSLRPGAAVLDVGCGHGVPLSSTLLNDGFTIHGIDASTCMTAEFRRRIPDARVVCETVEESQFFGRSFEGILAWGVIFLLSADAQRALISKVASALTSGGSFLFTAPAASCTWADALTGRESLSLGAQVYKALLSEADLFLVAQHVDEGDNHYYEAAKT